MRDRKIPAVPVFATVAITLPGVNLLRNFFVLWMLVGFFPVLVLATLIHHGIDRYEA